MDRPGWPELPHDAARDLPRRGRAWTENTTGIVVVTCRAASTKVEDGAKDDIHIHADQPGREFRQLVDLLRPSPLDDNVSALDVAKGTQSLPAVLRKLPPKQSKRTPPGAPAAAGFCARTRISCPTLITVDGLVPGHFAIEPLAVGTIPDSGTVMHQFALLP
jgi:hypothetical protein